MVLPAERTDIKYYQYTGQYSSQRIAGHHDNTHASVSYTHLDVYKRQASSSSIGVMIGGIIPLISVILFPPAADNFPINFPCILRCYLLPVSYTHLTHSLEKDSSPDMMLWL